MLLTGRSIGAPASERAGEDRLNETILGFYQLARQVSVGRFQRLALRPLRELVGFDAAIWWLAHPDSLRLHSARTFDLPADFANDYADQGPHGKDRLLAQAARAPGRTITDNDLDNSERIGGDRIAQCPGGSRPWATMCTAQMVSTPRLLTVLTVWRKLPGAPFAEEERVAMQLAFPHLVEAHRINRAWHEFPRRVAPSLTAATAWCDGRGAVVEAQPGFIGLLRSEWPNWSRDTLPAPLQAALRTGGFSGRSIVVDAELRDDTWLLRARTQFADGRLGERERQVATMYAQGLQYRDIAQAIGTSPATVRNQLRASFRKLAVNSKTELARRLISSH